MNDLGRSRSFLAGAFLQAQQAVAEHVIKVTKKLAEAKDSAIARLQKERQKEQAKRKKLQKQASKKDKNKKKSDAKEVLVESRAQVQWKDSW